MKVNTENDNNFGYEKITLVVDNIPLRLKTYLKKKDNVTFDEKSMILGYNKCTEKEGIYLYMSPNGQL